jgi:CheY-like chemotaxis protein
MLEVICGSIYLFDEAGRFVPPGEVRKDASPESKSARSKILIVDDEKLIADTISEILENAGFEVAVAYDGWQAIEMVAKFKPDQLLTDVRMPRMNGVELAIAIRKMHPAVRILLFSAHVGFSETLEDAKRQGFHFELLPKPLRPSELIMRLRDQS